MLYHLSILIGLLALIPVFLNLTGERDRRKQVAATGAERIPIGDKSAIEECKHSVTRHHFECISQDRIHRYAAMLSLLLQDFKDLVSLRERDFLVPTLVTGTFLALEGIFF